MTATRTDIDLLLTALDVSAHELQALDPAHPRFDAQRPLLVFASQFEAARPLLAERYAAGHAARSVTVGQPAPTTVGALPAGAEAWWIEPLAAAADVRSLAGLRAIMERLYGPDGCPWDREQTHETLRKYLLEETYEAIDAIDRGDRAALAEELGDLLAHVLMHTSMAQEHGEFSVESVVEGIALKMVRRHPHVFGDEAAGSNAELLERWEQIKAGERASAGVEHGEVAGALDSVPLSAQALQQRAGHAGASEPQAMASESLLLAASALADAAPRNAESAVARLLWSAVRLARQLDVDAEGALRSVATQFTRDIATLEAAAAAAGSGIDGLPDTERSAPWARIEAEEAR